jgi:hypothetical protein
MTVGAPGGRILPVGAGNGATQDVCEVMSFTRAAGLPPINTVGAPTTMVPGPPGIQPGSIQGVVMSPTTAAGMLLISTVGAPGPVIVNGTAGWGIGLAAMPTGCGMWQCVGASCSTMSPTLAHDPIVLGSVSLGG